MSRATAARSLVKGYTTYTSPLEVQEAALNDAKLGDVGTSISLSVTYSVSWSWTISWTVSA